MSTNTIFDYTQVIEEQNHELHEDYMNLLWGALQTDFYSDIANERCKFCNRLMDIVFDDTYGEDSQSTWLHRIFSCSICGWWHELDQSEVYVGEGDNFAHSVRRIAVVRRQLVFPLNDN